MSRAQRLCGVDGCPGGWVVAEADANMESLAFYVTNNLQTLFDRAGPELLVTIDIPIGLPEREPRACDIAARLELGRTRRSSVFPAPARHAINASTFEEAQALNREALDVGMTIQTYCIMRKIAEVDRFMTPQRQHYIREVQRIIRRTGDDCRWSWTCVQRRQLRRLPSEPRCRRAEPVRRR